mgnify:CR=1 FL=1
MVSGEAGVVGPGVGLGAGDEDGVGHGAPPGVAVRVAGDSDAGAIDDAACAAFELVDDDDVAEALGVAFPLLAGRIARGAGDGKGEGQRGSGDPGEDAKGVDDLFTWFFCNKPVLIIHTKLTEFTFKI